MSARCPHRDCQGYCNYQILRDGEGKARAILYTCTNCGATWEEPYTE